MTEPLTPAAARDILQRLVDSLIEEHADDLAARLGMDREAVLAAKPRVLAVAPEYIRPEWKAEVDRAVDAWMTSAEAPREIMVPRPESSGEAAYLFALVEGERSPRILSWGHGGIHRDGELGAA